MLASGQYEKDSRFNPVLFCFVFLFLAQFHTVYRSSIESRIYAGYQNSKLHSYIITV